MFFFRLPPYFHNNVKLVISGSTDTYDTTMIYDYNTFVDKLIFFIALWCLTAAVTSTYLESAGFRLGEPY